MPRAKPEYKWTLSKGEPLKLEAHTHCMKGKAKGRRFKSSTAPATLPKSNGIFSKQVNYGSHSAVDKIIEEECRRLGI